MCYTLSILSATQQLYLNDESPATVTTTSSQKKEKEAQTQVKRQRKSVFV